MPTMGKRLLAVTPSVSLTVLTRIVFSRLVRFSGSAPGSFPNSSNVPFRIAIWMSSSRSVRRLASIPASSPSRRACISASLRSIDATASARPATSRGPDAAVGVRGSAPAFPSPAVGGFLLGVCVTCVSLDPAGLVTFCWTRH